MKTLKFAVAAAVAAASAGIASIAMTPAATAPTAGTGTTIGKTACPPACRKILPMDALPVVAHTPTAPFASTDAGRAIAFLRYVEQADLP
jgi:hypothetical protein